MSKRSWTEIEPKDAVNLKLPHLEIQGPLNEMGDECPWPWEPQQLGGAPIGQYHCGYCGGMNVAGVRHLDWSDDPEVQRWVAAKKVPRPAWLESKVTDDTWWGHCMHLMPGDTFYPREHCSVCAIIRAGFDEAAAPFKVED